MELVIKLKITVCAPNQVQSPVFRKPTTRTKLIMRFIQRGICSIWPHWKKGQRDPANTPHLSWGAEVRLKLNGGLKICISKRSQSRCGPAHHRSNTVRASVSSGKMVWQVVELWENLFPGDKFHWRLRPFLLSPRIRFLRRKFPFLWDSLFP